MNITTAMKELAPQILAEHGVKLETINQITQSWRIDYTNQQGLPRTIHLTIRTQSNYRKQIRQQIEDHLEGIPF